MAIADFNAGKFESGTQAARAYGVPPSTFYGRMSGKQPRRITSKLILNLFLLLLEKSSS